MAEYQEDNTYDFNLSFQSRWISPESKLLRKGRKKDPLCKKLRVSKVTNKYEENMSHGIQPEENKYTYDFALDENGIIVPGISTGMSNVYIYIFFFFNPSVRYEMDETRACE